MKRWLSKLTDIRVAAALALVVTPTLGLASTKGKVIHHTNKPFVHFQGQTVPDHDNGWYTPPRSPGFHDDFGS
jgi:hypothetical protein